MLVHPGGFDVGSMFNLRIRQEENGTGDDDVNYIHQAPPLLLDHDQIRLWPTTPIEGIPAPGSNKAILLPASIGFGHVALIFNWVADYGNVDPGAVLSIASSDGITRQDYSGFDDLVQAGEPVVWTPSYAVLGGSGFSPFSFTQANTPVMLSVDNGALGNFTLGHVNNTMQVTLLFYVLDLTTGLLVPAA